MTRIRLPRRWARAAALIAAAGAGLLQVGASIAVADPYGYETRGYCAVDSCGSCEDDTWWDRTCDFCRDRTDRLRTLRRKWYWKNNDRHITTRYPETSPFCSPTHGYFQTCWRPFPYECPRCPEYTTNSAGASSYPNGAPPMELAPATDAAQPGLTPGAPEPYFPQPEAAPPPVVPAPPESGSPLPPPPPEMFEGDPDAVLPLGFRSLPPVQEVFRDDGWTPSGLRPLRPASYGFYSEE